MSKPSKLSFPESISQSILNEFFIFTNYIEKSVEINDPLEKIKLIGAGFFGNLHYNPGILDGYIPLFGLTGETISGQNSNETKIYVEIIDNTKQEILAHIIGKNNEFEVIKKLNVI